MSLEGKRGISFDLSKTATGIARWEGGNLVLVDEISFSDHKYFGAMLLAFEDFITATVKVGEGGVDWVAYEEANTRHKTHTEQHFGMVGILAMHCYSLDIPLFGVHWATVKKTLSGKGNSDKPAMLAAAKERWPEQGIETHNMADATGVGLWVTQNAQVMRPQTPF